jgi:Uma2 family endonuclease
LETSPEDVTFCVVTDPARKVPTYEDVLAAPPNMVAEILLGQLHLSPRPARRHGRAASVLGMDLGAAFERGRGGPGGWIIFYEPELHLGNDIVVPDLGGWKKERFPITESEEAYFVTQPDWVCEVLSKSTARYDRTDKLAIYARENMPFVWLVDPVIRTLEVLVLQEGRWVVHGTFKDDDIVFAPPFEAVGLELGALWMPES